MTCSHGKREYGPASVQLDIDDGLFRGLEREQPVWMSHGDRSRDCRKASSPRPRRIPRRSPGSSRRSDICTASSSTPRSPTHRGARTSCATSSRASPASSPHGRPPTSSRPPWSRSATASIGMLATRPPTGRSSVHCRAAVDSAVAAALVHRAVGDGRPASMSTMGSCARRSPSSSARRSSRTSGCGS